MDRFWMKVQKTESCWLWIGAQNSDGYGNFHDYGTHSIKAHRFAYERLVGPIPQGLSVCHHCDIRNCVRPEHFFLGTQRDNMRDCQQKGRYSHDTGQLGSRHHHSKLTESDVRQIRLFRSAGETFLAIANRFGVSDSTIQNIFNGHTWGHVR